VDTLLSATAFEFNLRRDYEDSITFPGRAVQVDPIKPKLKAPESEHLKLKCEDLPLNSCCKFYLRRYTPAATTAAAACSRKPAWWGGAD
jgi:hypothetical protein